jgi:hypothetical protein
MDNRNAALKAAAKRQEIPMGVYAIRNQRTGEVFLGSSLNLPAILNRHRFGLTHGSHPHAGLSAAWRRDGAENFAFEILDRLTMRDEPNPDYPGELATMLALWVAELGSHVAGTLT